MNDVKLAGCIDNDLTLRHTSDRTPLVIVRLAVNNPRADIPDLFDVTVWGRAAERLVAHAAKGDQIIITEAHLSPAVLDVQSSCHDTVTIHAGRVEFGATATAGRLSLSREV